MQGSVLPEALKKETMGRYLKSINGEGLRKNVFLSSCLSQGGRGWLCMEKGGWGQWETLVIPSATGGEPPTLQKSSEILRRGFLSVTASYEVVTENLIIKSKR